MKTEFRMLTFVAAAFLMSSFPVAVNAATPAAPAKDAAMQSLPPDDPAKVAAAREFIKAYHPQTDPARISAMIDKAMPRMIAAAKSDNPKLDVKKYEADTRARILGSSNKVLDLQSHVVSRHFTLAEFNQLNAFFRSPIGKKLSDEQPKIQADMMKERNRQMIQGAVSLGKPKVEMTAPKAAPGAPAH